MTGRTQGGFTLLEMLVVIVLIAVAVGLVSYGITRGLDNVRAREAARTLALTLRGARTQAMTSGQPASVNFDLAARHYLPPPGHLQPLPDGMNVQLTTAQVLRQGQRADVVFFPDGSSTGGSIRLSKDRRTWRVDIAWLTGDVRWQQVQP